MTLETSVLAHRLKVMHRARDLGNIAEACRQYGISRTLFYRWRRRFVAYGQEGLYPRPTRARRWARFKATLRPHDGRDRIFEIARP